MTWGYYTPPLPSTWSNHWSLGWGSLKDKIHLAFDSGGLGPTWRVKTYPEKLPYTDKPDIGTKHSLSANEVGIKGGARQNSNLLKFSLLYTHNWTYHRKFHHKSMLGVGYLKTRVENISTSSGSYFYADDTLGWVNHGIVLDKYEYFRNQNLYLIFGYELTYKIGDRWNWNAQVMYNQGLFKMIRWHTYRTYTESLTNYTEFDEQWSFTRLSYFAFLTGVTYEFGK